MRQDRSQDVWTQILDSYLFRNHLLDITSALLLMEMPLTEDGQNLST